MIFLDWAMITSKGIAIKGIFYSCSEALSYQWFEKARTYGERKLLVLGNEANMENIFCTIDGGTKWLLCRRIDQEEVQEEELNAYYEKLQKLKQQRQGITKNYSAEEVKIHGRTYQGS